MIRVDADRFRAGITDLFAGAGMDADKAAIVAEMLVEADLIGHSTHGSGLVEGYLDALASGELNGRGTYEVVADRGACVTWRGNRLPGAWLVRRALDLACERVPQFGVVTVAIGGSHHTGALAAYLRPVTERGFVAEICCSTTSAARMAPFGGTAAGADPESARHRLPDRRRPDPDRPLGLDHHHHLDPHAGGQGRALPGAMGADRRRASPPTTRAR